MIFTVTVAEDVCPEAWKTAGISEQKHTGGGGAAHAHTHTITVPRAQQTRTFSQACANRYTLVAQAGSN